MAKTIDDATSIQFESVEYDSLSVPIWEQILKLRQDVFIVEQQSIYPDIDGLDQPALHILGTINNGRDKESDNEINNELVGYARILPPGRKYAEAAIGRVVISPNARGLGLGHAIVEFCVTTIHSNYPNKSIKLSAQTHLQPFYQSFGFESQGEIYDDGGIDHIDMVKKV